MYCYFLFYLKDFFLIEGKIYRCFLLRVACLLALTVFLCSFQVHAQNLDSSPYLLVHEKNSVVVPLTFLIAGDSNNSPKITAKVVSLFSMGLLFVVLLLAYRVKEKGSSMVIKYISHLFHKQSDGKNVSSEDSQTTDLSSNPMKAIHSISTETYNAIIKRINKFEKSEKFLRKDINLTWLSNHLNTNTKYLSEVIKNHTGKNFNGYINGLRIRYIINKLTEIPVYRGYKISYLAEESGFASPQVFAIAFKKEMGMTPSHFIDQLKNEVHDATL
ncbi:MAG: hypothetical protein DI622_15785 [Chryseobacterium sp.]|uniref:helix-turn-helix domain-containing protein n=1 Tax=Chryseobacterium sp. TaxID=1871047 RepID=UPI000DB6D88C|nr:helix-turn-helix transcriptional regulator [Chryseobacterium sp.]MPS63455.1 AraC family transcriptional regulator [Chryseobacterium sp.]PZU11256.1 MAG: hypothetical protein DI622_15785 [Chryseobacterium sp.]